MKKSQKSGFEELYVHRIRYPVGMCITLLNVTYKVFSNILYTCRKQTWTLPSRDSPRKVDDKSDFSIVTNSGRNERIFIHLLFIDFKSLYDSTDRKQMYVAMN